MCLRFHIMKHNALPRLCQDRLGANTRGGKLTTKDRLISHGKEALLYENLHAELCLPRRGPLASIKLGVVRVADAHRDVRLQTGNATPRLPLNVSLCLSRACLGREMVVYIGMAQKAQAFLGHRYDDLICAVEHGTGVLLPFASKAIKQSKAILCCSSFLVFS